MCSLHATKKLRDRAKSPLASVAMESTTWLGDWYGTVLFWRPQLALLVNEQTLFPVLMPLAPAASLLDRFPDALGQTLATVGVDYRFIEAELAEMVEGRWAKTANRSVVGVMNEFSFLATESRWRRRRPDRGGVVVGTDAMWSALQAPHQSGSGARRRRGVVVG